MDFMSAGSSMLSGSMMTSTINQVGGSVFQSYLIVIGVTLVVALGIYGLKRSGKFALSAGKSAIR